jgi:hypothetical protein
MPSFSTMRNVELSTLYYVETSINASWTGVEIVKSFLSAYDKTLPVVCVRLTDGPKERLEVGSNTLIKDYTFIIDVFATSDGQRIDLADFLVDKLKDGWVYYTHAHTVGSPAELTRTSAGRITLTRFIENNRVELGEVIENPDRFRHIVTFQVRKN